MQVDMKVKVPDGYELTGEYRHVNPGEYYLYVDNHGITSVKFYNIPNSCIVTPHLILKKIEKWRRPTIDDLKRVVNGGIPAKVDGEDFILIGWQTGKWILVGPFDTIFHSTCVEVKDE